MTGADAMRDRLAPGLLIAAPNMSDPRFTRAVILLAESSPDGALGFVLNRAMDLTLAEVAREVGFELEHDPPDGPVFNGGPVSPERGWVLFRAPGARVSHADTETESEGETDSAIMTVHDDIQLGATLDLLREFLGRQDVRAFRFLLGYSGWGPGQLEAELGSGAWLPLEASSDLLFDVSPDDMWETAIRRLGLQPGGFFMGGGGDA